MKKLIVCGMMLLALTSVALAQEGMDQQKMEKAMQEVQQENKQMIAHAGTFAKRMGGFVDEVAKHDTLSVKEKAKIDSTYQAYLTEYSIVRDSLSDEDVRKCSKAKVKYQKAMARIFVNKTSDRVSDTAENVGDKVAKVFKRTKKKIQGAFDALKND